VGKRSGVEAYVSQRLSFTVDGKACMAKSQGQNRARESDCSSS
jgi:hypothetical protein